MIFFGLGALSVGILVPYTSEQLLGSGSNVATSPYVISMQELGITVLPVSSHLMPLVNGAHSLCDRTSFASLS